MTTVEVAAPVLRRPNMAGAVDVKALAAELRGAVLGEVRFDIGSRAAYSTDASNFRQVPIGVVIPRTIDDVVAAVAVCRAHGAPIVSRGGGTSLAGQCTNTAVVIDWSKYCNQLVSVDSEQCTCIVQPGIVLDELNRQLAPHGLRYGPEPATHPNCTLGGMIGNNSCGATAQSYGKVVDNTVRLEVLCYDGTRFWCGATSDEEYESILARGGRQAVIYRQLRELADRYGEEIRRRYPDIPRRVSGYNLDSLLPDKGFHVAGALVGSESTLVAVLQAELTLVPVVKARTLVVLGYPDVASAAEAVPAILPYAPLALEGLDQRLINDERIKDIHPEALKDLPEGGGWLLVQFGGTDQEDADAKAHAMLGALDGTESGPKASFYDDPAIEDELWQVREAGLGATAHIPGHRDTWEGWEDSAVHPDGLAAYLRDLEKLYEEFGYADEAMPALYGHFGQGCVHTRIPFDLYSDEGAAKYRRFLDRAADLVVHHGGSLSGEHGDGQGRGALLPKMFGEELSLAFAQLKGIFDPDDRMNPGKVVAPFAPDENLRLGGSWKPKPMGPVYFSYPEDGGSFAAAANRCVGAGKCRQHSHPGGAVMCPSYQATMEEEHSTRGRARLLFEMLNGHGDGPVEDGWRSDAVRDALDLCLACKGCKSDCPVNVDMATYKAEFLSHYWRGRMRPRHQYVLGWLPLIASAVASLRLGTVVNTSSHGPALSRLATSLAGVEDRELPLFAPLTLQQWAAKRSPSRPPALPLRGEVLLWPDTFSNHFHPHVGQAAVELLESAGWKVTVPQSRLCCGLTWISTGQLPMARRVLRRSAKILADHVRQGGFVVGLEPSCTAVFRSDATELLPDDPTVKLLSQRTVTLAELLTAHTPGWQPPQVAPPYNSAVVQVHCHQHAVLGWEADQALLETAGVHAERLESGCCGLAGNFGFEPGHKDVSEACAERVLMPRLRQTPKTTAVLADGFSCRAQIHLLDGAGREALHLAELLNGARKGNPPRAGAAPETSWAVRPSLSSCNPGVNARPSGAAAGGRARGRHQLFRIW
jgi:FAD/FMN-containing dehydrogenase/Fe-S oxidoreductase